MSPTTVPRVVVAGGARTPFARAGGPLAARSALELAVHAVDGLLDATGVEGEAIDGLACGVVVLDPRVPHLAREVGLASRLPATVPALTLVDNCVTGLSGIAALADAMRTGRFGAAIAAGTESTSNPSLTFRRAAARRFLAAARGRSLGERLRAIVGLRPRDFLPQAPAVAEPSTGLTMGEHCEIMVKAWKIPREAQDEVALRSHRRAHAATEDGRLTVEIRPLDGLDRDPMVRADTSMERLAALAPVFDASGAGTITAGSSSPLTDGAAAVLLATEARAERAGLEPIARVRDVEFAAIDPDDGLLMAPAVAVPRLLARNRLALGDIDLVEMHEAFAGQVLCNLAAWERGWKEPAIGTVDVDRLNVAGGSIAIGHPFAATGIRVVVTLASEMRRRGARLGLASVCGAGATAGAVLLERDPA